MKIDHEILALTLNLDVDRFWEENDLCQNFTTQKPRCALSFSPDDHWLFEFLQVSSTLRYYFDKTFRDDLHKQANSILHEYVGKSYFDEDTWENYPKRIENLFDCEFTYHEGSTPWLTPATNDPDEFSKILDKAEKTDLQSWAFPEAFLEEWESRKKEGKLLPHLGTGSRGPATIMTSVLTTETVFLWMYDYPEIMKRFRDILQRQMVAFNQVLRVFSGNNSPGWWITDDNSALFSRKLYHTYCVPVLQSVLDTFAPLGSRRYQHSDSSMGHLLDFQNELGINVVNYGPDVDVGLIREKMPAAFIHGQMPPFLLRNGSPQAIQVRLIEDFRKGGTSGGLTVTTAGSLAAGTGVERMRLMMQLVEKYCRYEL
jgi:uroporphyrinogen decarboxylase